MFGGQNNGGMHGRPHHGLGQPLNVQRLHHPHGLGDVSSSFPLAPELLLDQVVFDFQGGSSFAYPVEAECFRGMTFLKNYDHFGQILVILVLACSGIHIIMAAIGMVSFIAHPVVVVISSMILFMNSLLIVGVVYHRKEFLVGWLWFYTFIFFFSFIVTMPKFPIVLAAVAGFGMLLVYTLLKSFEQPLRMGTAIERVEAGAGGAASLHHHGMYVQHNHNHPGHPHNNPGAAAHLSARIPATINVAPAAVGSGNLLTENELVTISATIAAQELAMQRRQAALNAINPDAGLPTYDEVMRIVKEEEMKENMEKKREAEASGASASASNSASTTMMMATADEISIVNLEDGCATASASNNDHFQDEKPPPPYGEALRLMMMSDQQLPNMVPESQNSSNSS